MDIEKEKRDLIEKFQKIEDPSLIKAIKNLMDIGLADAPWENDSLFQQSLEKSLEEAKNGLLNDHNSVMENFRKNYGTS